MQTYIPKTLLLPFTKLAGALAVVAFGPCLYAAPVIVFTDPNPTFQANAATCAARNGQFIFTDCSSTAFLSVPDPAGFRSPFVAPNSFHGTPPTASSTLESAFTAWNQGTGDAWTLVDGGALDITFNVSRFDARVNAPNATLGGMDIIIETANYAGLLADGTPGPDANRLAWTQALYINYRPSAPDQLYNTLDTFTFSGGPNNPDGTVDGGPFGNPATPIPGPPVPNSNTTPSVIPANTPAIPQRAYDDPIYPFQGPVVNGINSFGDAPRGRWDVPASFRGITLLSTVTFQTDAAGTITDRILTVFNGVSYGFDLNRIPEPALLSLAAFLLICVIVVRHRRRLPNSIHPSAGGGEC